MKHLHTLHPEFGEPALAGTVRTRMVNFASALRAAGLRVGVAEVIRALRAVDLLGMTVRDEWYWALEAVFVQRAEDRTRFAAVFREFWRSASADGSSPDPRGRIGEPPSPQEETSALRHEPRTADERVHPPGTRAAAIPGTAPHERSPRWKDQDRPVRALYSAVAVQAKPDVAPMSEAELRAMRLAARQLARNLPSRVTRRYQPDTSGSIIDRRASLRAMLRTSGDVMALRRCRRRSIRRPVVVLCDVSGSMGPYASALMYLLADLVRRCDARVFLFGTGLQDVTRVLRMREGAQMLGRAHARNIGWGGGTRIGESLRCFRYGWSRRSGGSEAEVLLISDGLDRGSGERLEQEMARLARSSHRIVWLNPLLGFPGYTPLTAGAQAIARYADETRPV